MSERPDRRVARTKERLQNALMSLIREKGYDKLTVSDLIDRADVGRSTFYAHYETKDDLLVSELQHLTADIELHMVDDPGGSDAILSALGLFRHIADNHELFKALIGSSGIDLVQKAALDYLTTMARGAIDERSAAGEHSEIPADVRAAFAAGSLMALLGWWVDSDMPHTAETMAGLYRRMSASV